MNKKLMYETFEKFSRSYELEKSIDTNKINSKTYFDNISNPQSCRFCKGIFPKVTFKNDAHLIPKLLGSKHLLSNSECDNCNEIFKRYENDLANFIGLFRSIAGITGKSKNPKHKSKDLEVFQSEDKTIRFVSEEIVQAIEEGNTQIPIKANKSKHTPLFVFKALLKIALSVINDNELVNFHEAFQFLTSEKNTHYDKIRNALNIIRIFIPGPSKINSPVVDLWKRKNDNIELPEKLVVIHIKNLKFLIPIPLNYKDNHLVGKQIEVPMCPVVLTRDRVEKHGDFQFEEIDLSSQSPVKDADDTVGITIKNIKKHSVNKVQDMKQSKIDILFDHLDDWRLLPAYQLERRADIFFAIHLKEIFRKDRNTEIDFIIPEFPLRIGNIGGQKDNINKSFKIDYLAFSKKENKVYLIELKTDMSSRRGKQDWYLENAVNLKIHGLIDGLIKISKATNQKVKYNYLLGKIEKIGWINREGEKLINLSPDIVPEILYIQPLNKDGKDNIIAFDTIIRALDDATDPLTIRFKQSLERWKSDPNKK